VNLRVLQSRATGNVDYLDLACLGADVESLVEGAPDGTGKLLLVECSNFFDRFWSVFSGAASEDISDVVDADEGNSLIHVDQENLLVSETKTELDLSVAWHGNGSGALAILNVEGNDAIDTGGQKVLGVLSHVEARAS